MRDHLISATHWHRPINRATSGVEQMITSHRKTVYEALGREPVHPFPARMAPGIALDILSEPSKPVRVLDPMMGSGTVIALARSQGHRATGFDIDPLAVLISKVWSKAIDPAMVQDKAAEVLERARSLFLSLSTRDAYPTHADQETRRFTAYWFDDYARRQLAFLSTAISRVHDDATRDVLWCSFSRLIIAKQAGASLAMDLAHSRPHKSYDRAPAKPLSTFATAVARVIENCVHTTTNPRGPEPRFDEGDARCMSLSDGSVDLVLTSPPYLNAIDYLRCSKFSLIWMGHKIGELRRIRARSVGTEVGSGAPQDDPTIREIIRDMRLRPKLTCVDEAILARYIDDARLLMRETARVLSPGGKAVYVVGENTIRGTYVRNSVVISAAAELCGLKQFARHTRKLPANRRYLPPPMRRGSAELNARMRREVVLGFTTRLH